MNSMHKLALDVRYFYIRPSVQVPQGGILPPLLYCSVKDSLFMLLNDSGFYSQSFADDLRMLLIGICLSTVSDLIRSALNLIGSWCQGNEQTANQTSDRISMEMSKALRQRLGDSVLKCFIGFKHNWANTKISSNRHYFCHEDHSVSIAWSVTECSTPTPLARSSLLKLKQSFLLMNDSNFGNSKL